MIRVTKSQFDKNKIAICFGRDFEGFKTVRHVSIREAYDLSKKLWAKAEALDKEFTRRALKSAQKAQEMMKRHWRRK